MGSAATRWLSIGSAVLLALLAVGAFFLRKSPFLRRESRPAAIRSESPSDEPKTPDTIRAVLPSRENPTDPKDDDDVFPPLPRDPKVEAQLAEDRGKICRAQWEAWQKYMTKEFDRTIEELGSAIDLPPDRRGTLAEILRVEENAWMKDMEERLQPAFEGKGPPSYEFISTDAYRGRIDTITRATDAQIRSLLEDDRWKRYTEWRKRYNQRRYFVAEGK